MSDKTEILSKIKNFFKSNVKLDNLSGLLEISPYNLIGIDNVSAQVLLNHNINTIDDLSQISPQDPPIIKEISQSMIIKWIEINSFSNII